MGGSIPDRDDLRRGNLHSDPQKPWKQGENLDIMVPIGYNTVIVKSMHHQREKLGRDRFEEAFYEN